MTRTVTDRPDTRPNGEMGTVGYLVAVGSLIVLLPLLPLLAVLKLVDALGGGDRAARLRDRVDRRRSGPEAPTE